MIARDSMVSEIVRACERRAALPEGAILAAGRTRDRRLVQARGRAAAVLHSWGHSMSGIARFFGCDESTVRYQVKKLRERA